MDHTTQAMETLRPLADRLFELAMLRGGVLVERVGGLALPDRRKIRLFLPSNPKDMPKTAGEIAGRRFNKATDVRLDYRRVWQPGSKGRSRLSKSKIREVDLLSSPKEGSLPRHGQAIKKVGRAWAEHMDRRRLHGVTTAAPMDHGRSSREQLVRHYTKAGFKDRTEQDKARQLMRATQQKGEKLSRSERRSIEGLYREGTPMHRPPRPGQAGL